jgi:hypothetical protein
VNAVTDSNSVLLYPIETRNASPVTDSDSSKLRTIESRNDDGLTDHQRAHLVSRAKRDAYRESEHYGIHCAICGGEIGARFAIKVSLKFYNPSGFLGPFWGWIGGLACIAHKELIPTGNQKGRALLRCDHCGRDVFTWKKARDSRFFCCNRCEWSYYNAQTKARTEIEPRACKVCGKEFIPPRKDAITCSPKCRQKAYRERVKSGARESTQ